MRRRIKCTTTLRHEDTTELKEARQRLFSFVDRRVVVSFRRSERPTAKRWAFVPVIEEYGVTPEHIVAAAEKALERKKK